MALQTSWLVDAFIAPATPGSLDSVPVRLGVFILAARVGGVSSGKVLCD
jgi:hypothetical protein